MNRPAELRRIFVLLLTLLFLAGTACSDDAEPNDSVPDVGADTGADAHDTAENDIDITETEDTTSDAAETTDVDGTNPDTSDSGTNTDISDDGTDTGYATGQACPWECELDFSASMRCEICEGNWCFSPESNQEQDYCTVTCSDDSDCEIFGMNWSCGSYNVCQRR